MNIKKIDFRFSGIFDRNIVVRNSSILCLVVLLFSAFKPKDELKLYNLTGVGQGTSYHIKYYAPSKLVSETQIDALLTRIDSSLSIYKPYSLISQFNNSQTGVSMDYHFKKVVKRSQEISRVSDGAFDITVYPLVKVWGFGVSQSENLPNDSEIKEILKNIGYKHLTIDKYFLEKDLPGVKIDVNGIAQGYTVDLIAELLEEKGIKNYLVELGGEIRVRGKKPDKENFKIGIEAVSDEDFIPITKYIEVTKGAVTTSGNYRKFHQSGNKKINHLMNPKTGYYLQNDMISATVYAKNGITADGFDNVLMNLGLQKALIFLKKHKRLSAYLVYTENGVVKDTCSVGFPVIKRFE